jgi:EAL domain-containing protein (putative c-di-GMP-specific phosphodiesterase class I)
MRNGLKNEEFLVYFQPQVDARDEKQVGMEALIRWRHPEMGMISPAHFIPLAESTGFVVELDRYMMRRAMHTLKEWYDEGLNPGILSLNLSIRHLQSEDFFTFFTQTVQESGCEYHWLGLEVTESQLMQNPDQSISILEKLSDLGVTLSIDDFGTGYSSLSYLKRLPIDKLKIDRSFIIEVPQNKEDAAIVQAVIALAKTLHLDLVAEGVELESQKEFLLENDCCVIQGFYYSKAISAEAMRERLNFLKDSY